MSSRTVGVTCIRLTYKEGCGELWVEKRLRQSYPRLAMFSHIPRLRRVELYANGEHADEVIRSLHRESWVAEVKLTDSRWHVLPPLRQPFPPNLPKEPEDMEKPFPGHRR